VGQKVLAFVYFTIIARAVGVEGSGRYFVAVSFTTIFSIFVDLGLSNVLVREVAKFPDRAQKLLSSVLGIKSILAVLTAAAALITAKLIGFPAETRLLISVAAFVMVLDSVHLVFYAVMRGYQNLRYEAIGMLLGQVITITAGLTFILFRLPLVFLVVALVCGSSWNVLWSGFCLMRRYGVRPKLELDPATARFFWQVTVPFALAGIFARVYSYIDSVMLSRLVSEQAVGLYAAAYKMTFAFQFLPMAFAAAIYPAMSGFYVSDRTKLGQLFAASIKYLTAAVMPIAFGIFALAEPLVRLVFGREFSGAVMPLRILIFSLVFAFLYWPAGSLLNACDRQARNTAAMGITMGANVLLNLVLIPKFGAVGAAVSALVGNFLLFSTAVLMARGVTSIPWRRMISPFVRITMSGAAMAIVVGSLIGSAHIALIIPLGAAVYCAALFGLKALTVAEAKSLLNIFLRRGKVASDIVAQ
jgi:O-antigen/teichoic acid export membrane protein